MRFVSNTFSFALRTLAISQLASTMDIKRQVSSPLIATLPSPTPNLDCFNTVLKPTSTCSASRGIALSCEPSIATRTVCRSDRNCFKNSLKEDVCLPRNDKVAPAGIIFAVGVAIVVSLIAITLIWQRIQRKRKIMQARDDRVTGIHMGMTGSQKVEVTFVGRRVREGDDGSLLHDVPPAYTEADRKRGIPTVSLNGSALPTYDEEERGRRNGRS